jgi:hypothetical protein
MMEKSVLALSLALLIPAATACAEPSKYRLAWLEQSVDVFRQNVNVEVLRLRSAKSRNTITKQLTSRLDGGLGRRLVLQRNSGTLEVFGDGTRLRFRGDIDNENERAKTAQLPKLSSDELESLGRAFISRGLGDIVKLGRDESITYLGSKYLKNGGSNLEGTIRTEEVVANIAVFGREVNHIPVAGPGSKLAIWFANDREPVAFDVDWPTYIRTKAYQEILPRERLIERINLATQVSNPADAPSVRIECGYIDQGGEKRGAVIQGGCSVSYEGLSGPPNAAGERMSWGRIQMVPAAIKVIADAKWPLAKHIAEKGELRADDIIRDREAGAAPTQKGKR